MKKIAGILLSAAVLCGMCGCKATYQSGYDDGYYDGYLAGEKEYTAGYYDGYQEGEKSYQAGYDEGYDAGYQEGISSKIVPVKVYGDFTATVRDLIPDYIAGQETARAALITFFQDTPFVIILDKDICEELEIGETYTFIVDEQEAYLPYGYEFFDNGEVSREALILKHIWVTGFRAPVEEEYGLKGWRVFWTEWTEH